MIETSILSDGLYEGVNGLTLIIHSDSKSKFAIVDAKKQTLTGEMNVTEYTNLMLRYIISDPYTDIDVTRVSLYKGRGEIARIDYEDHMFSNYYERKVWLRFIIGIFTNPVESISRYTTNHGIGISDDCFSERMLIQGAEHDAEYKYDDIYKISEVIANSLIAAYHRNAHSTRLYMKTKNIHRVYVDQLVSDEDLKLINRCVSIPGHTFPQQIDCNMKHFIDDFSGDTMCSIPV